MTSSNDEKETTMKPGIHSGALPEQPLATRLFHEAFERAMVAPTPENLWALVEGAREEAKLAAHRLAGARRAYLEAGLPEPLADALTVELQRMIHEFNLRQVPQAGTRELADAIAGMVREMREARGADESEGS